MSKEQVSKELTQEWSTENLVANILKDIITRLENAENVIEFLESEKWYPMAKVTNVELRASTRLNTILERLIIKIKSNE